MLVVDMRDYTHVRYLAALRRSDPGFLILSDQQTENLARIMQKRLAAFGPALTMHINGPPDSALWGHLIRATSSIGQLCNNEGWDLYTPPKPPQMRNWNNWGRIRKLKEVGS